LSQCARRQMRQRSPETEGSSNFCSSIPVLLAPRNRIACLRVRMSSQRYRPKSTPASSKALHHSNRSSMYFQDQYDKISHHSEALFKVAGTSRWISAPYSISVRTNFQGFKSSVWTESSIDCSDFLPEAFEDLDTFSFLILRIAQYKAAKSDLTTCMVY
jgi:hypothetical protein